jgi:hypothetical protein
MQTSSFEDMPTFPTICLNESDMPDSDFMDFLSNDFHQKKKDCTDSAQIRREMARATGREITKYESGQWSCSREDEKASAAKIAKLITVNRCQQAKNPNVLAF